MQNETAECRFCHRPFSYVRVLRPRLFCSDVCRDADRQISKEESNIPDGPIKEERTSKVRWSDLRHLPENFTVEELSATVRHAFRRNPRLCADCPFCGEHSRFFARVFGNREKGQLQMACMDCGFERIEYEQAR